MGTFVAEQMPKVSHAPTVKGPQRKIPQERRTLRATARVTPLRPKLARKMETETRVRSFPPGHIPRELGFKSRLSIGQRTTGVFFSFARWKSVFFYMCTGQTSFSPLRSQRIGSHTRDTHGKTISGSPPPCSPKSIYIIANLVSFLWSSPRGVALTTCEAQDTSPLRPRLEGY